LVSLQNWQELIKLKKGLPALTFSSASTKAGLCFFFNHCKEVQKKNVRSNQRTQPFKYSTLSILRAGRSLVRLSELLSLIFHENKLKKIKIQNMLACFQD
jgi:hypothetical protein